MNTVVLLSVLAGLTLVGWIVYRILPRRIVVPESHRGLLYRGGKLARVLEPGTCWTTRWASTHTVVDLRQRWLTVRGQEVLTSDSVGLKISLALRYSVADAARALHEVTDYTESLHLASQLALRSQLGTLTVDELLEKRLDLGGALASQVAAEAALFGITVHTVDIKDVMFPGDLKRAFGEVLKARKEGQAGLEKARAESAQLRNLANAARLLEKNPELLKLRTLETLDAAGKTGGNTLVVGLPQLFP